MKTSSFLLLLLICLLSACNQTDQLVEAQPKESSPESTRVAAYNAQFLPTIQMIVKMTYEVMNGAAATSKESPGYSSLPTCAKVYPNPKENTVVVDFSDGCMSPYGQIVGSFRVTYSGAFGGTDTKIKVRFDNFGISYLGLNGTLELSDFRYLSPTTINYKIKATNLTVYYDGKYILSTFDMIQTWQNYQTQEKEDDNFWSHLTGNFMLDSQMYTITTLVELFSTASCSTMTPLTGKLLIVADKKYELDYGKGKCDSLAELTVDDDQKYPIRLRPF